MLQILQQFGASYGQRFASDISAGSAAAVAILALVPLLIVLIIVSITISILPFCFIFKKAGIPAWKAIIPFYNTYLLYQIAWNTDIFWISLTLFIVGFVPFLGFFASIANFVFSIILYVYLAKVFKKGGGFAVGLVFLPLIFSYILAFDKSKYHPKLKGA